MSTSQFLSAKNPGKDFLITLNGLKLTGQVKDFSFSDNKSRLSFENDFGDLYVIHPATVYGFAFAFADNGGITIYESKFFDGKWLFLKVENRGQALSLYTSSKRQMNFIHSMGEPEVKSEKKVQLWLQFEKEKPFRVHRLNFKKELKKRMAAYPEIVEHLGKEGFKFRGLPAIVELCNQLHKRGSKTI